MNTTNLTESIVKINSDAIRKNLEIIKVTIGILNVQPSAQHLIEDICLDMGQQEQNIRFAYDEKIQELLDEINELKNDLNAAKQAQLDMAAAAEEETESAAPTFERTTPDSSLLAMFHTSPAIHKVKMEKEEKEKNLRTLIMICSAELEHKPTVNDLKCFIDREYCGEKLSYSQLRHAIERYDLYDLIQRERRVRMRS